VSVGGRIAIVPAIRVRVRGHLVGTIAPDLPRRTVVQRMSTRNRHGPHPLPSRVKLVLLAIHDRRLALRLGRTACKSSARRDEGRPQPCTLAQDRLHEIDSRRGSFRTLILSPWSANDLDKSVAPGTGQHRSVIRCAKKLGRTHAASRGTSWPSTPRKCSCAWSCSRTLLGCDHPRQQTPITLTWGIEPKQPTRQSQTAST
jgi:hypothetical protein